MSFLSQSLPQQGNKLTYTRAMQKLSRNISWQMIPKHTLKYSTTVFSVFKTHKENSSQIKKGTANISIAITTAFEAGSRRHTAEGNIKAENNSLFAF